MDSYRCFWQLFDFLSRTNGECNPFEYLGSAVATQRWCVGDYWHFVTAKGASAPPHYKPLERLLCDSPNQDCAARLWEGFSQISDRALRSNYKAKVLDYSRCSSQHLFAWIPNSRLLIVEFLQCGLPCGSQSRLLRTPAALTMSTNMVRLPHQQTRHHHQRPRHWPGQSRLRPPIIINVADTPAIIDNVQEKVANFEPISSIQRFWDRVPSQR